MTSVLCVEFKLSTPNKIRPKLDGPSTAVIHAHAQDKRQKNFATKPIPVMPVRNRTNAGSKTSAGNVETAQSPVETTPTDDSETEGYVNCDTESEDKQPTIGTPSAL